MSFAGGRVGHGSDTPTWHSVGTTPPGGGAGRLACMDDSDPHCDACLNGWEDLNPWDGVDYCECCEMWLCGICYAYLHGVGPALHVQA